MARQVVLLLGRLRPVVEIAVLESQYPLSEQKVHPAVNLSLTQCLDLGDLEDSQALGADQ